MSTRQFRLYWIAMLAELILQHDYSQAFMLLFIVDSMLGKNFRMLA